MNGASKILTVSYGTFSCTLEGFDDPFNTMRAIAEYFRDLAAEDRYFGAEPPTPDAAMLHKIAEREIQRRVEAKISDNGVILRADDAVAPKVTFAAPRAADGAAFASPAPANAAPTLAPRTPVLSSVAEAAPAIESAAVRLSRLRAAQAHFVAPIPAPVVMDAYGEDQDGEVSIFPKSNGAMAAQVRSTPVLAAEPDRPEADGNDAPLTPEEKAAVNDLRRAKKAKHTAAEERPAKPEAAVSAAVPAFEPAAKVDPAVVAEPTILVAEPVSVATLIAQPEPSAVVENDTDALIANVAQAMTQVPAAKFASSLDQPETDPVASIEAAPVYAVTVHVNPVGPDAASFAAETTVAETFETDSAPEFEATQTFPTGNVATDAAAPDTRTADAVLLDNIASSIRETLAGITSEDDQLAIDMAEAQTAEASVDADQATDAADNQDYLPEATGLTSPEDQFADAPEAVEPDLTAVEHADQPTANMDLDAEPAVDAIELVSESLAGETLALEEAPTETAQTEDVAVEPVAVESVSVEPVAAEFVSVETVVERTSVQAVAIEMAAGAVEAPATAPPAKGEARVEISAPVVAEKIQRARARVIKVRRLDTLTASGLPAEPPVDEPVADQTMVEPSPAAENAPPVELSPEAEADLQHELAALEAELGDKPAAQSAPQDQAFEPHRLPATVTDEASVNRLLEKAQTEADVPESKRRRSAIAHLKAAVLATVAERRINPVGRNNDQRMDPYRKDLDQAVRPVPSDKPAPLVLVSSQRIDRKPDAPRGLAQTAPVVVQPVRPRRIPSSASVQQAMSSTLEDDDIDQYDVENIFADPGKQSFQEFADSLGATSMSDLIEAAGAYCKVVLGRDSFTRPQLFQQVSTIPSQVDTSREDSLRGFGRLLRDGRMTKGKGGHYTLSETSLLLHEARRHVS